MRSLWIVVSAAALGVSTGARAQESDGRAEDVGESPQPQAPDDGEGRDQGQDQGEGQDPEPVQQPDQGGSDDRAPAGQDVQQPVAPPPAVSEQLTVGAKGIWELSLAGLYRVSAEGVGAMPVDAEGRRYGQNHLVTHRLSFSPELKLGSSVTLTSEVQLATGFLAWDKVNAHLCAANGPCRNADGSEADDARNFGPPRSRDGAAFASLDQYARQIHVRKLYLTWTTPVGQLRLGRMASHWGLGVLANGGDDESQEWGSPRFGEDFNYGDVVDRVLFATRPLSILSDSEWTRRWLVAIGGDVLVRDERTWRDKGDVALQAIGAVRYDEEDLQAGVYVAHRDLRDRNQDTLQATAFDLYGKGRWVLADFELYGAGEFAWVLGDTTLARNNAFTHTSVQQLGWVARAGARYLPFAVAADFEVGYASGDSNPADEFLRNFTFDPDYNPSLILFDQLRAAETVASAANVSDPANVGVPPSSARLLPTGGGVTNAVYLRPTVRWDAGDLLGADQHLGVRLAYLWAISEEDIVDPYNSTADGGGAAVNYQGGDGTQRDLGHELDLGIDYGYRVGPWVDLGASLQGGLLVPSKGFANAAGDVPDPITMIYGRLTLRWLPPPAAAQ